MNEIDTRPGDQRRAHVRRLRELLYRQAEGLAQFPKEKRRLDRAELESFFRVRGGGLDELLADYGKPDASDSELLGALRWWEESMVALAMIEDEYGSLERANRQIHEGPWKWLTLPDDFGPDD